MLSLALALVAAFPQDGFPKPGADPTGVVLDEAGKPIQGARVELRADFGRRGHYTRAIAQILRETPLPAANTDKDGEFVLPLARDQRTLGACDEVERWFWLVVEKDGYRTWHEPLTLGIAGYLGSRVVLPKQVENDPFARLPWPPVLAGCHAFQACASCVPSRALGRTPPSELKPASESPGARAPLTITVKAAGSDRTIPRAFLRFADGFYASATLRSKVPAADADGVLALPDAPVQKGLVSAFAAGYAPLEKEIEVVADRANTVVFELEPSRPVQLLTVDAENAPVPFAPVIVSEGTGTRERVSPLMSDSCGRLSIASAHRARPMWIPGDVRGIELPASDRTDLVRVTVPRLITALVLTKPVECMGYSWQRGNTSGGGTELETEGQSEFVVRCLDRTGGQITLQPRSGAAIQVAGPKLAPRTIGGFEVDLVDQRQIAGSAKR